MQENALRDGIKPKILRLALAIFVLLAVILISQFEQSSAEIVDRPLLTSQSDCLSGGGSWSGSDDTTGTCTYVANGALAINACGANQTYLVVYSLDPDFVLSVTSSCVAASAPSPSGLSYYEREPEPEIGQKCKLIEIDSVLSVGGSFNAKWIGVLESIRFRQPLGGLVFITAIPGTLSYEQIHPGHDALHRSADFQNGFKLDRGRWQATCWGPEGTFGTAFIINVQ